MENAKTLKAALLKIGRVHEHLADDVNTLVRYLDRSPRTAPPTRNEREVMLAQMLGPKKAAKLMEGIKLEPGVEATLANIAEVLMLQPGTPRTHQQGFCIWAQGRWGSVHQSLETGSLDSLVEELARTANEVMASSGRYVPVRLEKAARQYLLRFKDELLYALEKELVQAE